MPQKITLPTTVPVPAAIAEAYARYDRAWAAHDETAMAYMQAIDAVPLAEQAEADAAVDAILAGAAVATGGLVEAARTELERVTRLSTIAGEARTRAEHELAAAMGQHRAEWVERMEAHEREVRARYQDAVAVLAGVHRELVEARALPSWLADMAARPHVLPVFSAERYGQRSTPFSQPHGGQASTSALVAELVEDAARSWSSPAKRWDTLADAVANLSASGGPVDPSMRGEGQGAAGWQALDRSQRLERTTKDIIAERDAELAEQRADGADRPRRARGAVQPH